MTPRDTNQVKPEFHKSELVVTREGTEELCTRGQSHDFTYHRTRQVEADHPNNSADQKVEFWDVFYCRRCLQHVEVFMGRQYVPQLRTVIPDSTGGLKQ